MTWEDQNFKMHLMEISRGYVNYTEMAYEGVQWFAFVQW